MGIAQGPGNKKDLNFELNLMPVFDILAVCICFLLMTVVWVEIQALETKQAVGGQSLAESEQRSSLWFSIDESNNLTMTFKSKKKSDRSYSIVNLQGQVNWNKITSMIKSAGSEKFAMAHILPAKTTKYNHVIQLMDLLKQNGIQDIGLSPI